MLRLETYFISENLVETDEPIVLKTDAVAWPADLRVSDVFL